MFLVLFLLLLQGCLVGRRRCCCSLNGRRAQIAVSMNNLDCLSGSVSFYELDVNKLSFHFTLVYSSRNSLSYEISRSLENKCLALFVASMHISSGVLLSLRQTPAQLGSSPSCSGNPLLNALMQTKFPSG